MPLPRLKLSKTRKPTRSRAASWVALEQRLDALEGTWCDGEILNLPGWRTLRYKETAADVIILAEPTTQASCTCGATSSELQKWGLTPRSHIRDVPIRCKRTSIYFRLQRTHCTRCGKKSQQPLIGVDDRHALTARLVEYIERESFSIFRTFAGVADEVGCCDLTVRNIFTARAQQLENDRVIETPRWISMDEVYPKERKKVHCVITDPERHQVIELLPNDSAKDISLWLLQLPNRHSVEVVTIDMDMKYRRVVRRMLPQARIVVDRYHVHNLLSVAFKEALEVLRDQLTHTEQRRHLRRRELLLKNYRHLSEVGGKDETGKKLPSEQDLVKKWLAGMPDLEAPYRLKNDFSDILQLTDRRKAEELTDLWLERAREFVGYFRTKYKKNYRGEWKEPFGNVLQTIPQWRCEILNYIDYKRCFQTKATNSFAEFANKMIRRAYKAGNGYDYPVLRAKVINDGVLVNRRPPHPVEVKWTRTWRDRAARRGKQNQRQKNPKAIRGAADRGAGGER